MVQPESLGPEHLPTPEDIEAELLALRAANAQLTAENAQLTADKEQLIEENAVLKEAGTRDELTGLRKRNFLIQRAEGLANNHRREDAGLVHSFALVDLDHFKRINDTRGHAIGDYVLKVTANVLTGVIKRPTDVVSRWGGEEFGILMPRTEPEVAKKLLAVVRAKLATEVNVTFSGGIAMVRPGLPFAQTVEVADQRLYAAKRAGRDQVLGVD